MKKIVSLILVLAIAFSMMAGMGVNVNAATQVETILNRAAYLAANNPHAYDGLCLAFCADCYKAAGYAGVSMGTAYNAGTKWIQSTSSSNIPVGALVFFDLTWHATAGHVGIYAGNGKMYDAESQYGGIKLRNFTTKGYRGWGWYNRIAPTGSSSVDITIPTISFNKSSFIVGETANISWTASPSGSNLKHYWLVITNTTTGKQYHGASVGTNSFSFKLTESGTIKVDVYAVRQDGSGKSDSKTFSVRVNSALNLGDNFYAYIIKKDSWKHLANENNNLQLALKGNDSYSPRQIWHFIRQTNGSYKIISEYDGQSLDADGRGTANETNVKLYNSYDTDAQKWFIYKNGSGYNIASSYCDKVFDVAGGKDVAGTNVQFYTSNSSCAQIFSIYKITTDGWTYQKPSAPSKPTVSTNVKSKTVTVSWSKSAVSGKMDNREYDIRIYKNSASGEPIFVKYGLTGTSYFYTLSDSGTYYVTIAAVNSKYYNYFTISNAVKFTVSSTCSHTYTSKITKSATCTAAGVKTFTCSKCGDSYTQTIAALGHDYKDSITKAATCTEKGVKTFKCSRCTSSYTQDIAVLGHDYISKVTDTGYFEIYNGSWECHKPYTFSTTCTRCNYWKTSEKSIPIRSVTLQQKTFVYTGSMITPVVTVKNDDGKTLKKGIDYTVKYESGRKQVGIYCVKVYFNNEYYEGTATLLFKIVPKGTALSKLIAGKKCFAAQWSRHGGITGYQIQYSTNVKFIGAKLVTIKGATSARKTIKNLKAKQVYYVRVRTYKTVSSTHYMSVWSKTYKVKTK